MHPTSPDKASVPANAFRLPSGEDLPRLRRALLDWHRRNGLQAPWRTSGDPYLVLVAAVMAQQTQMSRVLPKYDEFVRAFPTVESLAHAPTAKVLRAWEGMGYNMRALRLHRAAKRIAREGGFPRTAEALAQIDGIGPFTAAIVSSFAYGEPAAAVDTNVARVLRRLAGDLDAEMTARAVGGQAERLLSRRAPGRWNQAMMDLGALVCTARAPKCEACPIARWCRGRRRFGRRAREARVGYRGPARLKAGPRQQAPFHGSRRYYRGRIVQALRELPPGESIRVAALRERLAYQDGLDNGSFRDLLDALARDGLVRIDGRGRVRLP